MNDIRGISYTSSKKEVTVNQPVALPTRFINKKCHLNVKKVYLDQVEFAFPLDSACYTYMPTSLGAKRLVFLCGISMIGIDPTISIVIILLFSVNHVDWGRQTHYLRPRNFPTIHSF